MNSASRIDEAPDQPRTGDAVDLRVLSRHPLAGRRADRPAGGEAPCNPAVDTILQVDGIETLGTQGSGHALADLAPMHAVHDHRAPAWQLLAPALDLVRGAMERGHDEFPGLREVGGSPNVNDDRR